ncbi:MAG TPA: prealbumin-like fold domain-containing protein, partial [Marmoricola sp.]|nr:prealbumin-like fold domain-containing protein [Marmoricola sp.]
MNSNRTSAGPTGFGWVRSLLTFRHRNPVARFLSALVAFAMATLLVVGSGAAYGSDPAPTDPTATDTSTPAPDPAPTDTSTPTVTTTDPTPATDSTPSTAPPSISSTVTAPSTKTTTTTRKSATGTSALTSLVSPLALITPLANTGDFEIDGDLAVNNGGSYDWANRGDVTVDVNHDGTPTAGGTGFGDNSGYQGSSKEGNLPSSWTGFFGAQGQADIGKVYDWSQVYHDPLKGQPGHTTSPVDGHQLAYFAFTRDDTEGTMMYDVEYNRLDNSTNDPARPDRSVGDVMFQFEQQGSITILLKAAYVWAEKGVTGWSGSCEEIDNSGFGWCPLTTTNAFTGAVGDGGRFAEGMLDLTALQFPSGTCLGDLGTMNIRSHSSLQWTSALQDYMVADVNIAGTCGSLTIEKKGLTGDTLVPGAAFSIVDDPRPGKTGTYNVFDGTTAQLAALTGTPTLPPNTVADGTADGRIVVPNAEPGTYTVTELRAPAGYLLPAPADRTQNNVVVGNAGDTNADVTVTFRDPKQWVPLTASKTATGHYDIGWDITKQVSAKADPAEADWKSSDTAYSSSTTHDFKYRVRVTQQAASNYRVTGSVTVHNPNSASVNATLTEVPGVSGASCSFDSGVGTDGAITVAPDDDPSTAAVETAGTSYPYTCSFATPPAAGTSATGTNTAHLEWSQSAYPQNQGDVDGTVDATRVDRFQANPSHGYSFTAAADQPVNVTVKDYATVPGQADPVHHTFTAAETGGAGAIDANGDWTLTWTPGGGPYTATYSRTITGTAGQCTADGANPNTASIYKTGSGTALASSTANAKLCVGADIDVLDKNATGTLYRTYPWSIRKTTSTPELNSGVSTTGQYDITVTTGPGKDARWGMTGTIQVRNPNAWGDGIALEGLSDVYYTDSTMTTQVAGSSCTVTDVRTGGTDADPVFTPVSFPYTIPNATTRTFRYSCTFDPAQPDPPYTGTNKATATWDATLAHTPNGSDYFAYQVKNDDAQLAKSLTNDWIKNLVNATITVYDDNATPGDPTDDRHWDLTWSQVYNNNAGHSLTLDASSDPSTGIVFDAPGDGTCATHTNTVTITSDGRPVVESDATEANHQSTDDNSAQVRICNPATLTGSKTATPEFTRTYNWHVVKQVRTKAQYGEPAGAWQDVTASWTGDAYSHDFEYRVIVERGTPVDSLYKMSGTITVHNPNTDSNIAPISATVSEPATIGGVAATCSIDDGNLATPPNAAVVTLASNTPQNPNATDVTLPYTCELAGKPADGTRNSVTVAWGAGAGESTTLQSPAPGVTYDTPTTELDKSVTAVDDMGTTTTADDVTLGTVTWDQAGVDGYTFPVYTATHTATTTGCSTDNQWTNTVTISSGRTVKDTDSATAAICPNAGTWQVSKTSDVHDGPVPVDSDITYTLTATKTGGVNPKNVVLTDDLSSLAPHVSLPTLADLQAAAPAGTTVGLTGNVITWTIAELSGTVQLDFTVHVNADAYNVNLPNLVTSTGSDNCDPAKEGFPADECDTDNVTPHYTLRKSSDAGAQVMPPY